jgi:hypothetical protein
MLNIEQIKGHLKKGQPTKYDKGTHIELLVDIFSEGGSIAAFCAETLIDKKTFDNWKKAHAEFKHAYDVVINIAETKWEQMPFVNTPADFNHASWFLIMKNRFGFGKPRIDFSEEKTPEGRIEVVYKALGEGELTIDEVSKLANLVGTQADITNGNATVDMVKFTREQIKDAITFCDKEIEKQDCKSPQEKVKK